MDREAYIDSFLKSVGISSRIAEALREEVFRAISRQEEAETCLRDCWGNWEWPYCSGNLEERLYAPWLDTKLCIKGANFWPDGKKFALCLTHDVDDISFMSLLAACRRLEQHLRCRPISVKTVLRDFKNFVSRNVAVMNLREWLDLEDGFGFHSTFFCMPNRITLPHIYDPTYRYHDRVLFGDDEVTLEEAIREIDRRGWGIGLHGSYYSACSLELLRQQKRQLEKVIGREVYAIRQHWLHYDVNVTPLLQAEAGFKVDSSQGFNRSAGFRSGTSFPYFCFDHQRQKGLSILQVPLIIMDSALFNTNALEYDEEFAKRHCDLILERVADVGGCLTLNFHADYLYNAKYFSTYRHILQEAQKRGAWGCSIEEFYNFWCYFRLELDKKPSLLAASS